MISYVPDGVTESIEAIRILLAKQAWADTPWEERMRLAIAPYLHDDNPILRFLALQALPWIYPDFSTRAEALADCVKVEVDGDVLTVALQILQKWVPPDLADPVVMAASRDREDGRSFVEVIAEADSTGHELQRAWAAVNLSCYLNESTPYASVVVTDWFQAPWLHADIFGSAVSCLRDLLSFYSEGPLKVRSFELVGKASFALARGLSGGPASEPMTRAADSLIQELYFASGAFDGNNRPRPTRLQKTEWFSAAIGSLESLTAVTHPHSCHRLLETFEFLIDEDPGRVFRAIADTVGSDGMFRYESMGVDIVVRVVEKYLADYRQVFVTDPSLLNCLRGLLEVFARVGWPAALRLSYGLGDIFR